MPRGLTGPSGRSSSTGPGISRTAVRDPTSTRPPAHATGRQRGDGSCPSGRFSGTKISATVIRATNSDPLITSATAAPGSPWSAYPPRNSPSPTHRPSAPKSQPTRGATPRSEQHASHHGEGREADRVDDVLDLQPGGHQATGDGQEQGRGERGERQRGGRRPSGGTDCCGWMRRWSWTLLGSGVHHARSRRGPRGSATALIKSPRSQRGSGSLSPHQRTTVPLMESARRPSRFDLIVAAALMAAAVAESLTTSKYDVRVELPLAIAFALPLDLETRRTPRRRDSDDGRARGPAVALR